MNSGYSVRLGLMEDWYRDLLGQEDREQSFILDYAPHRAFLERLRGSVIDIGGGAGLAGRYLHSDVSYLVVEPSEMWSTPEWVEFGAKFRASGPKPKFVTATGEKLPFPDGEFDIALSLWTLNHVRDPAACVGEMARVLKPGGEARIVLEDVEPGWGDLFRDAFRRVAGRLAGRRGTAGIHMRLIPAFKAKLAGRWPLQEDHSRIDDRDLMLWLRDTFEVRRRSWIAGCLTYDLVKPAG